MQDFLVINNISKTYNNNFKSLQFNKLQPVAIRKLYAMFNI